eukprot:5099652-Amphidinium_carterae.2
MLASGSTLAVVVRGLRMSRLCHLNSVCALLSWQELKVVHAELLWCTCLHLLSYRCKASLCQCPI